MSDLSNYLDRRVGVVTFDGRYLTGELIGSDQATNLILGECEERILSSEEPMESAPLGLYLVRGDNVVIVGTLDKEKDEEILGKGLKIEPMHQVTY